MTEVIKSIVGNHVDPASFGFRWEEVEPFYKEHEALHAQYLEIVGEAQSVAEQAEEKRQALPQVRAEAIRAGIDETATTELKQLEEQGAVLEGRTKDLKRAAELVERDLQAALEANRNAYLEQVQEMRDGAQTRAESLRAELAGVEFDLAASRSLASYLTKIWQSTGGRKWQGISVPPPAHTINNI